MIENFVPKEEVNLDDLLKMKMHDTYLITWAEHAGMILMRHVIRVPGGWVYETTNDINIPSQPRTIIRNQIFVPEPITNTELRGFSLNPDPYGGIERGLGYQPT
jgi:hypothetical protein